MIDLHCHVLPGIDDGAADLDEALAMVRVAEKDGVSTIVATPHVNGAYDVRPEGIASAVASLNSAVGQAGIAVTIVPGAELAVHEVVTLTDEELRLLCIGDGPYILLESPFSHALPLIESSVARLRACGLRPVMAHPERSQSFLENTTGLRRLVEGGVLTSVTAGSVTGQFGGRVYRLTCELLAEGLVHNVSSDAHDSTRRIPVLTPALERIEREFGAGEGRLQPWLSVELPLALLDGRPPPAPPRAKRSPRWRRVLASADVRPRR